MLRCISLATLFVLSLCITQYSHAQNIGKLKSLGVLNVVAPDRLPQETFSELRPVAGLETAAFQPQTLAASETLHEKSAKIIYRHDVWGYEFSYQSLRTIEVDVPQPTGKMQRKVIWYLVYRVRNPGDHLSPQAKPDEYGHIKYDIVKKDYTSPSSLGDRFFPHFVLDGWVENFSTGSYEKKSYLDRVMPTIVEQIRIEEKLDVKLHNSVEISALKLPVVKDENNLGTWGVATWEDIDPRVDYVSVFVQGITNAFKVKDLPDGSKKFQHKTLQLNFWRPGDSVDETKDEIRVGVPVVDSVEEQVKICRHYDLSGPEIVVSQVEDNTGRQTEIFRVDGQPDAKLNSLVRYALISGKMPKSILAGFADLGIEIPNAVSAVEKVKNYRWEFKINEGGEDRTYRLQFSPRFWEKVGKEIIIKDRLDYIWVYR